MGTGTGSDCHLARSGLKVLAGSEGSRSAWEVTPSWDDGEGILISTGYRVPLHIHAGEDYRDARQGWSLPHRAPGCWGASGEPPSASSPFPHCPLGPRPGTSPCPQPPRPSASSRCPSQEAGQPGRAGWGLVPSAAPGNLPRPSVDTGERSVPRCPVQARRAAGASPVSSLVGGRRVWGQIPPGCPLWRAGPTGGQATVPTPCLGHLLSPWCWRPGKAEGSPCPADGHTCPRPSGTLPRGALS